VNVHRPFFRPPLLLEERRFKSRAHMGSGAEAEIWSIDNSVFGSRRVESEGKNFFDDDVIYEKRLHLEWNNALTKGRFIKVMAKADDDGVAGIAEELEETREVLMLHFAMIARLFNYYCCLQPDNDEAMFSMKFNAWATLCRDLKLSNQKSKYCKPADCDNVFVATNFEEQKDGALADANDDLALMRFEFLEALTRVALLKFGKEEGVHDVSESVEKLLNFLKPAVPEQVSIEANVFRVRLYTEPCSKLFERHQHLLQAVYCFFRTGGRKKTLMLDGWLAVCDAAGWTTRPEMSGFDAKLVFMWSQMCISNEVTNRTRLVSLTWIEFLEAMGRVSEIFFPLGPRAKAAQLRMSEEQDWSDMNKVVRTPEWSQVEGTWDENGYNDKVLSLKISEILNWMADAMMAEWNCSDTDALRRKFETLTRMKGGSCWNDKKGSRKNDSTHSRSRP